VLQEGQKQLKGKKKNNNKINKQTSNHLFKGQKREVSQILILGVGKTEVSQTESKRNIKVGNDFVSAAGYVRERKTLQMFLLFCC